MDLFDLYQGGNDEVVWTIGIAMYIFLSGMSGGAFVLGASADALGQDRYRPLAKLGVVASLLLLALAPLFLILDLSQPLRAYYTLLYPHPTSVMSFGVYLLTVYGLVAGLYACLLFRRDLVHALTGLQHLALRGLLLSLLRLFRLHDLSPAALARDTRWARRLAQLGVGLALALASYTGFILAVVAARDMWHSALIPVLFLLSALVSGTALVLLLKYLADRFGLPPRPLDLELLHDLGDRLRHLFVEDVAFLLFWLITLDHSSTGGRESLWLLTEGPYRPSFLGVQVLLGTLVPLVILYHPRLRRSVSSLLASSLLLLLGIAAMRYNIVIGGQALPMSRGDLVDYSMSAFEVAMVALIFGALTLLLLLCVRVLPLDYPFSTPEAPPLAPVWQPHRGGGPGPATLADPDRRDFLRSSGSALALVALGGLGPQSMAQLVGELDPPPPSLRRRYAMVIDLRKCIGCHSCTQACKAEYDLPAGVWRSWVKKLRRERGGTTQDLFLPRLCNQCDDPPCVPVCPVQATFQDRDGIIRQREDRCIGCKYCIVSCPYSARFVNPHTHVVEKCDFCHDRLVEGRLPACVEACPAGARIFGDLRDADSEVSQLVLSQPTQTLKPELGTDPQVYYLAADQEIMKGGLL